MKKLLIIPIVFILVLFACSKNDNTPAPVDDGADPVTATYRITFMPDFTQANFPEDYPANPAFSGIFVAVHAPDKSVFKVGQLASDGVKSLAEDGSNTALDVELSSQGTGDSVDFVVFSLASSGGPTENQSIEIIIDPEKTSLSFLSSLTPSPDWFVGVDGFSLIESANSLITTAEVTVNPFDAGTDSGTTYLSADNPTNPPVSISEIDGPPIIPMNGIGASIGKILIERTDL